MGSNSSEKKLNETDSTRISKLNQLAEKAAKLNQGKLKEFVAVPSSTGGYIMEIREIN